MFSVWQLTPLFYGKIESSVVLGFLICLCTIIAFGQLDHFIGFILAATSICMFVVSKCSNFFSSFPSLESICRIFPWFGLNLVRKKVREMKEIKFFYHFNSTKPKKKGKHERKKEKERSKTLQDWWRNLELPWTKAWGTGITESMRSNIEIINLVSAQCKWGEFSKKPFFCPFVCCMVANFHLGDSSCLILLQSHTKFISWILILKSELFLKHCTTCCTEKTTRSRCLLLLHCLR